MFFIKFISYCLCSCVAQRIGDYLIARERVGWGLLGAQQSRNGGLPLLHVRNGHGLAGLNAGEEHGAGALVIVGREYHLETAKVTA
jgi:hypothetical protein